MSTVNNEVNRPPRAKVILVLSVSSTDWCSLLRLYFFLPNLMPLIPNLDTLYTEVGAGAARTGADLEIGLAGCEAWGCKDAGCFRSSRSLSEREAVVGFGEGVGSFIGDSSGFIDESKLLA